MRRLTDFLITFHVMKGLCGRGPALFGLLFIIAILVALVTVLIDQLYPGGFATFAWKAFRTSVKGFH
jgi:hypothetical protein